MLQTVGKIFFCERGLGKSMLIAFITVNCGHDVHSSCLLSYSHRENSYSVALVVKIEKVFLSVKKYPSFCCQCPKNEPKYLELHVKLSLYHFYSLLMEVKFIFPLHFDSREKLHCCFHCHAMRL